MSVKQSHLTKYVIPLVEGMLSSSNVQTELVFSPSRLGITVTTLLHHLLGKSESREPHLKVVVHELSDTAFEIINSKSDTFSFNIRFLNSENSKCFQWFNGVPQQSERVCVPVISGQTPGFVVFVYKKTVVAAFCIYATNFNQWADFIGLRRTTKPATKNPSTHFVWKDKAIESGLLWFSPNLDSIGGAK